jgi:hypothetical protein
MARQQVVAVVVERRTSEVEEEAAVAVAVAVVVAVAERTWGAVAAGAADRGWEGSSPRE